MYVRVFVCISGCGATLSHTHSLDRAQIVRFTGIKNVEPRRARGKAEVKYQWKGETPHSEDRFSTVLKKSTTPCVFLVGCVYTCVCLSDGQDRVCVFFCLSLFDLYAYILYIHIII